MDDKDETIRFQLKSLTDRVMLCEKKLAYLDRTVSNRTRHFDLVISKMAGEVRTAILHIRNEFSRLLFTQLAAMIFVFGVLAFAIFLVIHTVFWHWIRK